MTHTQVEKSRNCTHCETSYSSVNNLNAFFLTLTLRIFQNEYSKKHWFSIIFKISCIIQLRLRTKIRFNNVRNIPKISCMWRWSLGELESIIARQKGYSFRRARIIFNVWVYTVHWAIRQNQLIGSTRNRQWTTAWQDVLKHHYVRQEHTSIVTQLNNAMRDATGVEMSAGDGLTRLI